jgi:glucuronoarabinoxylan endo-1,4-beta-xylanase
MLKALYKIGLPLLLFPVMLLAQGVTVNFSKSYQIIDGFGGASVWCGALSDQCMDAIFKNGPDQLGFTINRCRLDPHNSWADEKSNATKAKERGAIVFATPWSPPESLKTNKNTIKGYIDSTKFASFASWMKDFVNFCGPSNIDIMSIENEPDYAQQINYEGCGWSASNFLKFCRDYAPTIGKPIMMPESFGFNFALSDPTLNDSVAASHISYIGGHLYGSQPKTYTKAINLGKHVWMTEWNASDYSANGCMVLAKQMLDCMYNNFNAYVYWWMTWDGNGIISKTGVPNNYGYVMSMFSKYVRPGYYRVDATYNPQSGVYVVAFKGAQNVIVAVNNSTSTKTQSFTYSNADVKSVQKYTASQSKKAISDGTITATNNSFTATLDAQSITTFVSTGTTSTIPFRIEDRNSSEKTDYAAAQLNSQRHFMYMLNGKRWLAQGNYRLGNVSSGIYIFPNISKNNACTRVIVGAKNSAAK